MGSEHPQPEVDTASLATLIRLETKLDLVIGQHSSQLGDHETRLRIVESTPTVSPKGLTAAIASSMTILLAVLAILDKLTISSQ